MKEVHVCNVGDSLTWTRWKSSHPCLLPKKRYLYWTQNEVFVIPGTAFIFGLQGLGPQELQQFGLQGPLSLAQAQDLCGNAFTSHVIAVVGLAALLHILTPA